MTLENIVPSLEDCKRIPEGEFKESAFVWVKTHTGKWVVGEAFLSCGIGSRRITALEHYPAPTLAEILAELPACVEVESTGRTFYLAMFDTRNKDGMIQFGYTDSILTKTKLRERDENPATAALRLWKMVNGGEEV